MKRFLTILCATVLLTAALCVTASASDFDSAAQELSAIGIFRGDSSGFALDRSPTRSEAAIMLVRLYGAEEEAKAQYAAGEITHPFTDVSDTAAPYAAWLKTRGIVNGVSDTAFGSARPCTLQNYAAFLLRALGYQDKTDFAYADAQDFALAQGILDLSSLSGQFLRDDLAAMTYQALGTDLKDGSTYLLDSLIQSGAVDAQAAKPITDKITAYRALTRSSVAASQGLDADVDAKMEMSLSLKGTGSTPMDMSQKVDAAVKGNIKVVLGKDLQMAMELTMDLNAGEESETQKVEYWVRDGVMYVRSGETAYQTSLGSQVDMESLMALVEQTSEKPSAVMLPFVDTITAKASGEDTVYTLTLNDAFSGIIDRVLDQVLTMVPAGLDMDMKFAVDTGAITYTVGKDGSLKDAAIQMNLTADVNAAQGADSVTANLALNMDMTMTVKAMGGDVKITFPDFSGFQTISAEAAAGILGGGAPSKAA